MTSVISTPDQKRSLVRMRQVVAADFCQKTRDNTCSTGLLEPGAIITAYVQAADGSVFTLATVNGIAEDAADVEFKAPADFKPAFLLTVTFENETKAKTVGPTSVVKQVTFGGDRPKSFPQVGRSRATTAVEGISDGR